MVTEGTYPQSFGGVSVWCDQLVRGLPHHGFDVHAISANGAEKPAWELPDSVTVHYIPMWNSGPQAQQSPDAEATELFGDLLEALFVPGEPGVGAFMAALRQLADRAADGPVSVSADDEVAARLLDAWQRQPPADQLAVRLSVHDALHCASMISHWLRPLLRPAPIADLTHAVTNGLATLPALAAKWTYGTPLLLTEHGVYLRERYLGLRSGSPWPVKSVLLTFQRLLCTTAYRWADLITPGNRYNHRWEMRSGATPDRIRTVYNGVDPAKFPPAGREPDVPTLTWAGRIDPIKDLETLVRSFALVHAQMPQALLRIFGGTPAGNRGYHDRCVALARELGVGDAVVFEGRVDDIRDAYAAGHVVVLSSISEGFPYTLIEAMTSGRATVSTDVGGVAEAVADTGLVVPPRDAGAMADACLRLLRDGALRHRLGTAARNRALQHFTVGQAIDAFDGIYRDLVRSRTRATAPVLALGRARVADPIAVIPRQRVGGTPVGDEDRVVGRASVRVPEFAGRSA